MATNQSDVRFKTLRDLLTKMGPQLAAALPKHIPQERFIRVMLTTIRADRKGTLLECGLPSILGAMMRAAQDGLELDGTHAALVAYKDHGELQAHYQQMYRGMIALARRSGEVSTVRARAVYRGDTFEYKDGLNPVLDHIRGEEESDDAITHVYAIAEMKDGSKQFEVMTVHQVREIRNGSKAYQFDPNGTPWATDFVAMACKTVAKRLLKWCPCAAEVQRSLTRDDLIERGQMAALSGVDEPLALPAAVELDRMPTMDGEGREEIPTQKPADRNAKLADQVRKAGGKPPVSSRVTRPRPGEQPRDVTPTPRDDGPPAESAPPPGNADGEVDGA